MKKIVFIVSLLAMACAYGAALTANRLTLSREGDRVRIGVRGTNEIFAGSMVAVGTDGYAVPAAQTAGLRVIGKALEYVKNTGAPGSVEINIERGVHCWANAGSKATRADIGKVAYVIDDQTVTNAITTQAIIAGFIVDVTGDGVWVDSRSIGGQGAAAFNSLTTVGNVSAAGNVSAGGNVAATSNLTAGANAIITGNATITGNASIGGTLTYTTQQGITGTPVVGVAHLPEGYAGTNVTLIRFLIGTTNYVIPAFRVP